MRGNMQMYKIYVAGLFRLREPDVEGTLGENR